MKLKPEERHNYMKNWLWINGTLCYWRDNPNYSEKTKRSLEKRMKEMTKTN